MVNDGASPSCESNSLTSAKTYHQFMLLSTGVRRTLIKFGDRVDDLERQGSNPWGSTKALAWLVSESMSNRGYEPLLCTKNAEHGV